MYKKRFFIFLVMVVLINGVSAQAKRFDTSMKIGRVGYRVFSNNKSEELNTVTISPLGFEKEAREVTVQVKGRVNRSEVDDLNGDGFPDLVIYVINPGGKAKSTVFAIASESNQGFKPIYFPDVYDDQKLRVGYQGYDQYSLMEGMLMRRFPLYNATDTANIVPTGMIRQVQYRVMNGERGELRFKVMRSYEYAKQ